MMKDVGLAELLTEQTSQATGEEKVKENLA